MFLLFDPLKIKVFLNLPLQYNEKISTEAFVLFSTTKFVNIIINNTVNKEHATMARPLPSLSHHKSSAAKGVPQGTVRILA